VSQSWGSKTRPGDDLSRGGRRSRALAGAISRAHVGFGIGQRQGTATDPLLRSRDDDLEHDRPLNDGVRRGWAGDYLEPGDSGGPWVRRDDGVIMGVHRGGSGADNISSIHQTRCWIAHVVGAYGGEGPQAPTGRVPTLDDYCD